MYTNQTKSAGSHRYNLFAIAVSKLRFRGFVVKLEVVASLIPRVRDEGTPKAPREWSAGSLHGG
jgi:hypothetical protein